MFAFEGKPGIWWLNVKTVLDIHGIKDAEELSGRLYGNPAPTVKVTIPPGIMSNFAPRPPKPTVGRIVHFFDKEGNELPAIIVAASSFTPEQWVYLKAFVWGERREDISDFAIYSEEKKVRTWHWPEKE